uniref:BAH domain-containing protein n=1 Tax=Solanum lycopersicum TaxID=4081 RepID=A0A3Q7IS61_SOLLC
MFKFCECPNFINVMDTPTSERRRSVVMAGHLADEVQLPNELKAKKSNILWSRTAWTCAKQRTHYPSFRRNGTTIAVNSFVIFTDKKESQHVGYLEDFYENKKGQNKVKVRCFEYLQDIKCAIPELEGHPREVLFTSHVEGMQANCIDAIAIVLTPGDYDKYISLLRKILPSGVYVCSREIKYKIMPFSLNELEGYYSQTIFIMSDSQRAKLKSKGHMLYKVLDVSQKRMKVQYDDIEDCDAPEKLEEWVPSYRVAGSDKLGMRCTGRLTVRPRPLEDSSDYSFEVGAAVDAWWSDGWWEGVVAEIDVCGSGHHQVYFPGENMLLEIQRKNLRTSRDWIDGKWVEVEGKKDIKSSLTDLSKCSIKEHGNCEKQMAPKLVAMKTTNCCQFLSNQLRSKTMMLLN